VFLAFIIGECGRSEIGRHEPMTHFHQSWRAPLVQKPRNAGRAPGWREDEPQCALVQTKVRQQLMTMVVFANNFLEFHERKVVLHARSLDILLVIPAVAAERPGTI
jgi:hypothetical protein